MYCTILRCGKMERTSRDSELENYLDALNDFVKKPSKTIPTSLEQLIQRIARHGEPLFPWFKLKPLIVMKLENVIEEYIEYNPHEEVPILPNVENVRFDDMRERLLKALESFNSAPFTIQRLCELLTEPKRYYRRSDKFMRGVEKNVQVVSTVTPSGKRITSLFDLQKSPPMMNGIVADTDTPPPTNDNNGFVRPDSDAFNTPSSSSSRIDSMNGVSRPYYQGDPMDAPLQFSYPLGQAASSVVAASVPSSESSARTDLNRVDDSQSKLHETDAKESSEAVPDVPQESSEMDSRTSEERTAVGEDCADVDTASVVSSSDVESFAGDSLRKEDEEEEMEVDVASSDASSRGDGDSADGEVTTQDQQKEEGGDVSTSASASGLEEKSDVVDEPGKADSSEDKGSKSSTPMDCEESFPTNSEAASSGNGESKEDGEEERLSPERVEEASSGPVGEQPECGGEMEAEASPSRDIGPSGDAGPADSSNDAQASHEETNDENVGGSSEADSKASSPESVQEDLTKENPSPAPEETVQSSADASVGVQGESPIDPPTDGVTDSTPSGSDPSESIPSGSTLSESTPSGSLEGDTRSPSDAGNEAAIEGSSKEQSPQEASDSLQS